MKSPDPEKCTADLQVTRKIQYWKSFFVCFPTFFTILESRTTQPYNEPHHLKVKTKTNCGLLTYIHRVTYTHTQTSYWYVIYKHSVFVFSKIFLEFFFHFIYLTFVDYSNKAVSETPIIELNFFLLFFFLLSVHKIKV